MSSTTPVTQSASLSVTEARTRVAVSSTRRRRVLVPARPPRRPCGYRWRRRARPAVRSARPRSRPLRDELRAAIDGVLDDGRFILGPEVEAFEAEFAAVHRRRHAIGCRQRHRGDHARAARRSASAPATRSSCRRSRSTRASRRSPLLGATPVFCDVDPATFLVTPESVRAALTPRTKAVIAVHLFGNVAPVARDRGRCGVPVVEDAAQAAGSTGPTGVPGALGAAATFSFYPSKNLGAFGDGGAVTTDDAELADACGRCASTAPRTRSPTREVGCN